MSEHDPLDRQQPDEPRFVLLARDPLAEGLTRLWAALMRQDPILARDIFENLLGVSRKLPYMPHRQTTHVRSVSEVANAMHVYLTEHRAAASPDGSTAAL